MESLERRTLLSATFANIPYSDPFPAPSQVGQPAQNVANVLYSDSFTDQSGTSNGVLGTSDRYWNEQANVTRPLPAAMQNGLAQMSVEFWLNVPAGGKIGYGTCITMPGFEANGNWNWSTTPAGVILMSFSTTKLGEPLAVVRDAVGVIPDGQWHQYAATFDGQTASFYCDGQLAGQQWLTNSADEVGPQVFSDSLSTPTAISYSWMGSTGVDEVRVSNIALTPTQVKRNFENYRQYTNTWYASPTGSSSNSGTRSSPLNLTTALSHVGPDTKIILLPGTYSGSQFQITRSGTSPLHDCLITGENGSGQAIISVTGSTSGALVSSGAQYVTLRNLTFSADQKPALTFSSAGIGNTIDGCRLTSNSDALSVVNSSGYQDPVSSYGGHYVILPGVMLENSVLAAGTSSAGARYSNSDVIVARNNTFVGGQYGAVFTGGSTDVTLLDNIFTGQTGSGVYFNSDSLMDVAGSVSLVSYFGDGNIYNPAIGGYVATVIDGSTNNYSTVSDYAYYWYTKQYGTGIIKPWGDSGIGIGYRSEQRSILGAPTLVSSSSGDYRLAATAPNLVDTGADYVYGRTLMGVSAAVWDGQGNARAQGNAVDAGAFETAGAVSATFTLATAGTTSAGVYDGNGKLIRTLWSGVEYPAGSVTAYWNGLDDNNNPMGNGNYTIKLLSNNVQYVWDGAMNNSNPLDGSNIQANFQPIQSMVIVGNNAYYNPGYNEGRNQLYKFGLANINQVTGYAIGPVGINDNLICNIASDGTTLYALWQTYGTNLSYITSYDLNFNPTGLSANVGAAASGAAGIAVQPAQQSVLFVSHTTDNRVYIFNKSTLAPYSVPYLDGASLGWNTPKSIATTPDGDLWVTCQDAVTGQWQILRYTNFGGTPTLAATVSGGLVNPIGLAVSLDGNKTLMVVDGETSGTVCQQIKAYTPAGASLWTLGQAGGYATNGPAITNYKFILEGMICPQADGSFWITDLATGNRTMHFSAARTFINDIEYTRSYTASADQNNPTRVFQNFVEYQIDYTKPFTQNQGWTPVNNWSYLGTTNLSPVYAAGGVDGLADVASLGNGRTYALVDDLTVTGSDLKRMVELTASGLRDTPTPWSRSWMDKDGSLLWANTVDNTFQFTRQSITGFDASGNPQYSAPIVVGTAPFTRTWDVDSTAPSFAPYWCPLFLQLDNGLLVTYNSQVHSSGMHLGALDPTTNQYQWQTMPGSGPFSGRGNYDTNNWYGGNRVMVSGHNIITGYNGEGWHGSGQANQFMQYNDDGLFICQFGTPTGAGAVFEAYGAAGNSFSPFLTTVNGTLYLYLNDESDRSLQRWHATGLDTIQETSLAVALGVPAAPSGLTATAVSSGQINLAWTDNSNNEAGFKIDQATNSNFTIGLTTVTVGPNVASYNATSLSPGTTYYYRVRATNTAGDSANTSTASATTVSVPLTTYEAECGTLGGSAYSLADGGASGGYKVILPGTNSSSVTVGNVNGYGGGSFTVTIRYTTAGASPPKDLYVNGTMVATLIFPDTSGWGTFCTVTTSITLNPGTANSIKVADHDSWGYGVEVDKLDVSVAPAAPASLSLVSTSDTGVSNSDRITNLNNSSAAKTLQFQITGLATGATVALYDGSTVIGSGVAAGSSLTLTTNGTAKLSDGSHNITATQSLSGTTSLRSNVLAITINTVAPTVGSFVINDGSVQRSMVSKLTITFSEVVSLSTNALMLMRAGVMAPGTTLGITNPLGDGRTYQITFSGSAISGGSLADGAYKLLASALLIQDLAGNAPASNYTARFHRLFGDADGDRDVDAADLARFRSSLNDPVNYLWYFDYDASGGTTDITDYRQLRLRVRRALL